MKFLTMITILSMSFFANASQAPNFSAFSYGDELYITILGDSCNNFYGNLTVEENCKDDRQVENFASVCSVELGVTSTKMACHDKKTIAKVLTLSLKGNNVASEAKVLELVYQNQKIDVLLNK